MKVLFDATPMVTNKTGIAYYIERLMLEMAKAHPEVEFVGFYFNFLGRRDISHLPTRDNLHYTGASIIPSKVIFQLRRWGIEFPIEIMALQRADFVLYGNFLGYPSLFHTPSTAVIHDLTFIDLPEYVSAKLQRDLTRFVPKQLKRSAFITTVSEFSKRRIQQEYKPNKDIIVTPIPPAPLQVHSAKEHAAMLADLGIALPYILFVGTIEPRKNLLQLIEGYKQLPKKVRDSHALVIAGRIGWNCEAEETALQQAKDEGYNVIRLGYIADDVREMLYQSATLFSTASHYEGFGMPILEAMSYGTPCAVSDIPVFREVAGVNADYFDQEKPAIIAAHLEALLSNKQLLDKLGRDGRAHVATFKWQTIAKQVFDRIQQAINEQ
ncbi:MAG: glycosyltransferase family 4 protein [Candidatus Saccharibacteria bacterium]